MIFNKESNVQTNLENSKIFKVETNSKMYKILSNSLYSDKIKAFIREILTNAADIHVQTKQEKPIDIYVPNAFNNYQFSVRDYGSGLSENDMYDIYTSFFTSTRDEDNMFTGCFGLGTKSPFAYTESFIVESYFNSTKSTYLIHKNDWIPSISKLFEEDTDEENGLYIKITIQQEDIDSVKEKLYDFLTWVDFKYNLYSDNSNDIEEYLDRIIYMDNKYIIFNDSHDSKVYILMGNVLYPININNSYNRYLDIYPYSFVIKYDIGQFDVQPSRESLTIDENSIHNIVKEIIQLNQSIYYEMNVKAEYCIKNMNYINAYNYICNMKFDNIHSKYISSWLNILSDKINDRNVFLNTHLSSAMECYKAYGVILDTDEYNKVKKYLTVAFYKCFYPYFIIVSKDKSYFIQNEKARIIFKYELEKSKQLVNDKKIKKSKNEKLNIINHGLVNYFHNGLGKTMNATTDIFNDNQALFVVDDKCRTNYSLSYIMNITNDISAFFKLYSVLFKNKVICATKSFYEKNKKYMDNVNITTLDNLFNYIIDKIRPYYTIDTKIHIIDKKLIDVSFFADHYYFLSTSHSNEYQYKKILLMYKYYDKEYYNFLYSLFDYFKHTSPYIIVTTIDKSIPKDIHKMCLLLNSFRIKSDNIYNNKSRQMSNWLGTAADMNKYKLIKYLDRHEIDKGSFHETNEYFKTLKDPNKIIYATCLKNNIIARYNQQNNRFYKSTGG